MDQVELVEGACLALLLAQAEGALLAPGQALVFGDDLEEPDLGAPVVAGRLQIRQRTSGLAAEIHHAEVEPLHVLLEGLLAGSHQGVVLKRGGPGGGDRLGAVGGPGQAVKQLGERPGVGVVVQGGGPGGMQGSGIRGDGIDAKLSGYRSRLASQPGGPAHPGASSVELSDFDRVLGVKQAVQDDIGAAIRAGRNNEARELGRVVSALDEALEASSAGYRSANDAFRTASREIDQIDAGIAASRPGRRAADTVAQYRGLRSDAQRGAYRAGYGNEVLGRIERAAEGVNKARPLTSQKSADELAAMARDPALLTRAIGRENTMFQTRNMALGGSQTADNLMDIAGTNALARIPTTAMGVLDAGLGAVNSLARGQNAATREAIVRALLSSGDEAATALAGAVARGEQLTRQQIALMRTLLVGGQQAGSQVAR